MKLEIKYPKISNLYSFISNLSQWNELVCIPERKKEWLQKTGGLNQKEKKLLKEFSQIFQRAKINLELIFLFEDPRKIWVVLSKKIAEKKYNTTQLIFKIFENRFNKIWKDENKKFKKISHEFSKRKSQIDDNLDIIRKICGLSKNQLPQELEVRLILSSHIKEDCQGWSFKEKVVLECSGWPIKKIDYLINNIFLHECFHILFKNNKKLFSIFKSIINKDRQLINKTKLKKWTPEVVFEEALISSFLPEGYLGEKFLNINSRKTAQQELTKKGIDSFTRLRYFCALYLCDLAKEYVGEGKPLDRFYLEKVVDNIERFVTSKSLK